MDAGSEADGHYQNYAEYSKSLRSWLVAYGIGGPVLFLTNKDVYSKVAESASSVAIVDLFLFGVGLQILLSVINKWAAYHMYRGAFAPAYTSTMTYQIWSWINDRSWIDFLIDLVSIAVFVSATGLVLGIFMRASGAQ